jgi:hypothetical protein
MEVDSSGTSLYYIVSIVVKFVWFPFFRSTFAISILYLVSNLHVSVSEKLCYKINFSCRLK